MSFLLFVFTAIRRYELKTGRISCFVRMSHNTVTSAVNLIHHFENLNNLMEKRCQKTDGIHLSGCRHCFITGYCIAISSGEMPPRKYSAEDIIVSDASAVRIPTSSAFSRGSISKYVWTNISALWNRWMWAKRSM